MSMFCHKDTQTAQKEDQVTVNLFFVSFVLFVARNPDPIHTADSNHH